MRLLKNALNVVVLTAVFTFAGLGLTQKANADNVLGSAGHADATNNVTQAELDAALAIPIPIHLPIHDGNTWYLHCPGCGGHTGIEVYFGNYRTIWIPIPIPFSVTESVSVSASVSVSVSVSVSGAVSVADAATDSVSASVSATASEPDPEPVPEPEPVPVPFPVLPTAAPVSAAACTAHLANPTTLPKSPFFLAVGGSRCSRIA